ncbi:MAG: MBOAT family O-acyltransferase [Clostridia bacterium]|nr:MBOAT family O-acyltransferase [Clostridia bacterium]
MLFSSTIFLFLFLPLVICGYFLLYKPWRNYFLLLASLIFYGWGEPSFLLIMLASILANYGVGLLLGRCRSKSRAARAWLTVGIVWNLGLLFVFKYLNFTLHNLAALGLRVAGTNIALPIGISFFTFQILSYIIDVYRGEVPVQKNPFYLGLYISFFPQLIAGPIVRYSTVMGEIRERSVGLSDFAEGAQRFIAGLFKKVMLANSLAVVADRAFELAPEGISAGLAWLGILCYTLQIFFDFAGYSDMAIGLGRMFGFHFLENFNYPYIAASVTEFWRRWHISLGTWFRDYVYIPLGGSRVRTAARAAGNIVVVWLLTGIWHGANWTFILWGLLHCLALLLEKFRIRPERFAARRLPKNLYRLAVLLFIFFTLTIFRAESLTAAGEYLAALLGFGFGDDGLAALYLREVWMFLLLGVLFSTPLFSRLGELLRQRLGGGETLFRALRAGLCLAMLLVCVSCLVTGSYNPFIYFNF